MGLNFDTRAFFHEAGHLHHGVCTKNLNPDVVMVKPAEDGL